MHRRVIASLGLAGLLAGCASMESGYSEAGIPPRYISNAPFDMSATTEERVVNPNAAVAPPAAPAPLAAPESQPTEAQLIQRQVIYSGAMRLVVVSVTDAINSINSITRELDGYVQESSTRQITLRVPAGKFDAAMERIGKLGEVVDRSVKASDVTEELLDLQLRIDTARKARDRLLAHLEKSEKMEDTLKIEAELRRLVGEIEQMEGKLRLMRSQVALSTIRVELNSNAPRPMAGGDQLGVPFPWVSALGSGLVTGSVESMPRQPKFLARGPDFNPPDDFVRYYSSRDLVEAMNAAGLRIKVQRHANFDRGKIGFWKELVRKALVETRSLAVDDERQLDDDTAWIGGTREVGGQPYAYVVLIKRDNDHVLVYEAWGPREQFAGRRAAIEQSARSLRR